MNKKNLSESGDTTHDEIYSDYVEDKNKAENNHSEVPQQHTLQECVQKFGQIIMWTIFTIIVLLVLLILLLCSSFNTIMS